MQLLLLPGLVVVGVAVGVSRAGSAVVLAVAANVRIVALRPVREEAEVTVAAAQFGGRGASLLAGRLGGGVPGSALLVRLDEFAFAVGECASALFVSVRLGGQSPARARPQRGHERG